MFNLPTKAAKFSSLVKKSAVIVSAQSKIKEVPVVDSTSEIYLKSPKVIMSSSLLKQLAVNRPKMISGIFSTQMRFSHTDIRVPDNTYYRRKSVKSPTVSSRDSADSRKLFSYLISAGGGVLCAYSAKTVVLDVIMYMSPPQDALAMAKIEVDLTSIPEGKTIITNWQGKPIFVRHRTAYEIEVENNVDLSTLRDPQPDSVRASQPEWIVLIGICTHLGCIPITNAGDYGGYFCPCHGSHYDGSGRIRKGPAPLNLAIPKHTFVDSNTLLLG